MKSQRRLVGFLTGACVNQDRVPKPQRWLVAKGHRVRLRLGWFASHPCPLDPLPSRLVLQPQAGALLIIGWDELHACLLGRDLDFQSVGAPAHSVSG